MEKAKKLEPIWWQEQIGLIPFYSFFIFLTFISRNNFFFWDTVQLASLHAHHYFETGFSQLLLPESIDSGHIPAFGMYIAIMWVVFGKTLFVSHLAMLPWLLGIVWQSYRLVNRYTDGALVQFALLLFLADPTLLGQSSLVSPDIVLVFFFLLAFNSILDNNRKLLVLGIAGLFLVSMRGMMTAFSLLIIDLFTNYYRHDEYSIKRLLKMSFSYLPAVMIALSFFWYHYETRGWIAYHEDSPWAESFERVGFGRVIYNIGILIWRTIDFGRVFPILAALILLLLNRNKLIKDKSFMNLLVYSICILFCLSISFVSYNNLSGHRYILPLFLAGYLIVIHVVSKIEYDLIVRKLIFGILILALLSGNLWIYPEKIAQGWDASLAHSPYFKLRNELVAYIDDSGIPFSEIGSTFPNTSMEKHLYLNDSNRRFPEFDIEKHEYAFYSNVYNNISDSDIDQLKKDFVLEKEFRRHRIFVRLYKKKDF